MSIFRHVPHALTFRGRGLKHPPPVIVLRNLQINNRVNRITIIKMNNSGLHVTYNNNNKKALLLNSRISKDV